MEHKLKRLSWPEGGEIWIAWNWSWMAVPVRSENGTHKEWVIVCLKDNPAKDMRGGDVMEQTYKEWYMAKPVLLELIEEQ